MTPRPDFNLELDLAFIKSTIGPIEITLSNVEEVKTIFNRIVKDAALLKLIMEKAPNQVHKVIQVQGDQRR